MRFGVKSDRGRVREINEDSFSVVTGTSQEFHAFIIADGMGGHNAGEIASRLAVDSIAEHMTKSQEQLSHPDAISKTIEQMMQQANRTVYAESKESQDNFGMGTTLIVAALYENKIYIGHIGDSRAYLVRGENIERITTDHSYIEELIKNGSLKREEAEKQPKRNLITRALGCSDEILIDSYICDIKENDVFMLCTDGLTNMVEEARIRDLLTSIDDPQLACDELVKAANDNGGEDNISVIVVKI